MATIITKTANNLHDIKEMFAKYNRDNYPNEVYQFILDTLESSDEDFIQLDVIAWACDISFSDLEGSGYDDMDELVRSLESNSTIICDDGETVWYLY